jgi:prophage DNA circulation protein
MTIIVDADSANNVTPSTTDVTEGITEETTIVDVVDETAPEVSMDAEVPAKYKGKSLEDVIEMHQNVEDVFNKHSAEVSESRKTIENMQSLINNLQSTPTATDEPEVNFEDQFYSDPAQAVNSAIENHPELIQAREDRAIQEQHRVVQEKQVNLGVLEKSFPDWEARVADAGFQKWVADSNIRTEMFHKADTDYRPDYAIELFQTYDAINMIDKTKEAQQQEATKREKALKQTSSETRSSGDSVGGKKIYRRTDLINLRGTDPGRYEALSDEIHSAYVEGRVR